MEYDMTARAIKFLYKSAMAASLLSAAAIIATTVPASASPAFVTLTGDRGTEEFTCTVSVHGINAGPLFRADNGCGTRLWLHKNLNGTGWGYCISGHTDVSIPTKYDNPQQAQVTSNKAKC
jgi:hypothetical protein